MHSTLLRCVVVTMMLAVAGAGLRAQVTPAFSCSANAGVPPTVRVEDITALVRELNLTCRGGTTTPVGQPVPPVNFQIFMNTSITSRLLSNPYNEALLIIDEPASSNQIVAPGGSSFTLNGVFTGPGTSGSAGINYRIPGSSSNLGQGVRNVYQGRKVGDNSLIWQGIPFDPPGTTTTRIIRISNVRANANQLGVSSTLVPTQITMFIGATGATQIPITNPQQIVAIARSGVDFFVSQVGSQEDCVSNNDSLRTGGSTGVTPSGLLRFSEGFATSFKTRIGSTVFNTETGFYNPLFPNDPTGGNLGTAGLADHGTRLTARFNNIQAGVQLWVEVAPAVAVGSATVGLVSPLPTPGQTGPVQLAKIGNTATAVWEVFGSDPEKIDRGELRYYVAYMGGTFLGQVPIGTITVTGGFDGPLTGTATTIPAFQFPTYNGAAFAAFTVESCPDLLRAFTPGRPQPNLNFDLGAQRLAEGYLNLILDTTGNQFSGITATVEPLGGRQTNLATAGWLTVTLNQPSTPATATVTVNPAGLAPGTYNGAVRFTSPGVLNSPLSYPVRLVVPPLGPLLQTFDAAHAASYARGEVSAGEAVVFFGERFGPPSLATLALNPDGSVATVLGETRVLFDNTPAPMIYAVNRQVAAFAPFGIAARISTRVEIEYRGVRSPPITLIVSPAVPGLFTADSTGTGQGAIFNQDGSFNNAQNPAAPGDIVVFFGTGGGQTNPPGRDGRIAGAGAAVGQFVGAVTASIGNEPAEVVYGGPAPGLVEGVIQVNARISSNAPDGNLPAAIAVGGRSSQFGVTVAVRRPPAPAKSRTRR